MDVKIELPREEIKNFIKEITPNKNFLYMFIPCSIGDFLIAGGLSYAVQLRKNKVATILIAQERMKNLAVKFENVVDTIYLPIDLVKAVDTLIQGTQAYEWDNFIYGNIHTVDGKIIWDETLNLVDRYKKNALDIPLDTPLMMPLTYPISAKNISAIKSRYILDRRRTIIILPHAKTFAELDEIFWEELTRRLHEKNYIVYTNVNADETVINGTEPIELNFSELNYIVDRVKCFIGLRSGALDFLAMTPAQIFSIHKFPQWENDLSVMYEGCNNKTFYDAVKYKSTIENYLADKGLSTKIKIAHKHIHNEDVYFSYEEILSGIVTAVEEL